MPVVLVDEAVPGVGTVDINLSPFDRFSGGGGRMLARLLVSAAGVRGDLLLTVLIGSDTLVSEGALQVESAAGIGVTRETPSVGGTGLPADPITVRIRNTNAAPRQIVGMVEIENA